MGGRGSTRWKGHQRAPLVEETPSIDLVALRSAGILAAAEATFEMSWGDAGRTVGVAQAHLGRESGGRRNLLLNTAFGGAEEPFQVLLELLAHTPNWGGRRWFLTCPKADCGRRVLRLYVDTEGRRIGCRQCLGLTHRSCQEHDARLDLARRDDEAFAASRAGKNGDWSGVVTFTLVNKALEAQARPRTGRGWGRRSPTAFGRARKQAFDRLVEDYEERWQRPFPGRRPTAKLP